MFTTISKTRFLGETIKEYYAITIPQNVELYTFTDIGKSLKCDETEIDFICDFNPY